MSHLHTLLEEDNNVLRKVHNILLPFENVFPFEGFPLKKYNMHRCKVED
jgi:hypothetical protein